ncbi:hypothetical protein H5T57_00485 [Candidatus Bipolaricaulota bacterium]|nr:hypothetical protein [Candidatus Bipolaricaulota bacterium]
MRIFLALVLLSLGALGQTNLVIYSSGLALVEEIRKFSVAHEGILELRDFPQDTLWETLVVEGVEVLSLLPLRGRQLEALLGKEVTVYTGQDTFRGILRAISNAGLVLETNGSLVIVREYAWLSGPASPAQAHLRYCAQETGEKDLRFRYLARGFSWRIGYDAELTDTELHVFGKAAIQNETGCFWQAANISLVAGEIYTPKTEVRTLALAPEGSPAAAFEYYRYDLPGRWDLPPGLTILPLVSATFPAQKFYRFSGTNVEVWVRFTTDVVLPGGEMRVYSDGLFVGAGEIKSLTKGETAEIAVGVAFDLQGHRTQLLREKLGENVYRETWRITLRSAKENEAEVEVIETLSGYWRIVHATAPYEILDAQRIKFAVHVPPKDEVSVEYTVEWSY